MMKYELQYDSKNSSKNTPYAGKTRKLYQELDNPFTCWLYYNRSNQTEQPPFYSVYIHGNPFIRRTPFYRHVERGSNRNWLLPRFALS